ncbi:hypothetical protein HKD37_14G041081 [Glycine soja]
MDLTLLRFYKDHTTGHVWIGQPKEELKLVKHGGNEMVKRYMDRSGMKGMYETRYTSMNKGTSFFHLPIGEMTIIVDDVSHLLHLLITGRFLDHTNTTYTRKEIKGILRARWFTLRGTSKVDGIKALLDRLQMTDVVWSPYASHKDLRPFED